MTPVRRRSIVAPISQPEGSAMRPLSLPILALAVTLAVPARAEIAPEALWSALRSGTPLVTASGGTASPEGDGLRVTDPVLALGRGPDAARIEAASLVLTPEGDGTRITLPDRFAIARGGMRYDIAAPGLALVATGAPQDPAYRIDAPRLTVDGPGLPGGTVALSLLDTAGQIGAQQSRIDAAALSLRLSQPDAARLGDVSDERQAVSVTLDGPPGALFAGGTEPVALSIRSGSGSQTLDARTGTGRKLTLEIGYADRDESLSLDGQSLGFEQSATALTLAVSGPHLPLRDAGVTVASSRIATRAPVVPTEQPQPFRTDIALTGIVPTGATWDALDPEGTLPRDPGTLSLRLSGTARVGPRGQFMPRQVALQEFDARLLGAGVSGQGAVEFVDPPAANTGPNTGPNSGPGATSGIGRPLGGLAFALTGVTELFDRLAALGTVPAGPLIGARMGLGFFTRPGDGPDMLTTAVEFAPDGQLVVNGQALGPVPTR